MPAMPRLQLRFGRLVLPLALAFSTASLAGCAKQLQAKTEFSADTNFAAYETYRWITDDLVLIQSGTGNEKVRNVENEQRIRAAVERELETKGLRKATGDEASLVLAFTVGTKVRYTIQGGGQMAFDLVAEDSSTRTRGTLTLYFFDRDTKAQVWQAWTSKDLEPGADPDMVTNAAVSVLLAEFPPQ